jgi:hypothetical protein
MAATARKVVGLTLIAEEKSTPVLTADQSSSLAKSSSAEASAFAQESVGDDSSGGMACSPNLSATPC